MERSLSWKSTRSENLRPLVQTLSNHIKTEHGGIQSHFSAGSRNKQNSWASWSARQWASPRFKRDLISEPVVAADRGRRLVLTTVSRWTYTHLHVCMHRHTDRHTHTYKTFRNNTLNDKIHKEYIFILKFSDNCTIKEKYKKQCFYTLLIVLPLKLFQIAPVWCYFSPTQTQFLFYSIENPILQVFGFFFFPIFSKL